MNFFIDLPRLINRLGVIFLKCIFKKGDVLTMTVSKIAILGAGNGGITAAADLSQRGFEVVLFENELFASNLEKIDENGGIFLQEKGEENFIEVHQVTTDIKEAVKDADVIMLTVPGFAIESMAEMLAPAVKEEQVIFLSGAGAMGALRFVNKARSLGIEKNFKIGETNSLAYGTRAFPEEAKVELGLRVKKLFFAAYPAEDTEELLEICRELYQCLVPAENVLHSTMENGNPEVHPGPSLLNAGRIDYSNGEFYLYKEGITKHTVRLLRGIEAERIAIGKAFGFELEDAITSRYNRGYFKTSEGTLQELFNKSEVYGAIKGPTEVDSRYFTEDISDGLVFWSELGETAGIATPNIDAVITIGGTILERDFYSEGLTLSKLGLTELSVQELLGKL